MEREGRREPLGSLERARSIQPASSSLGTKAPSSLGYMNPALARQSATITCGLNQTTGLHPAAKHLDHTLQRSSCSSRNLPWEDSRLIRLRKVFYISPAHRENRGTTHSLYLPRLHVVHTSVPDVLLRSRRASSSEKWPSLRKNDLSSSLRKSALSRLERQKKKSPQLEELIQSPGGPGRVGRRSLANGVARLQVN